MDAGTTFSENARSRWRAAADPGGQHRNRAGTGDHQRGRCRRSVADLPGRRLALRARGLSAWTVNYDEGSVTFLDALPEIHTGTVPKKVYASHAEPIFADVVLASDFVPPETSHSVTSTQVYGTTLGATSSTLGQGTFTAYLENGVSDALVSWKNQNLLVQVLPGSYDALPALCQGEAGHFAYVPGRRHDQASCTINAASAAVEA